MNQRIIEFHDYILGDVLVDIPGITSKRMFGGYGIYQEGYIFAIITSESDIYFKVDETNQEDYEALESHQFIYDGHKNKKFVSMPYWILPEEVMEDRGRIAEWVEKSVMITQKSKEKT